MFQKNKKLFIAGFFTILLAGSICYAGLQNDYFGPNAPTDKTDLPTYIAYLYQASIIICTFLAFWSLIAGGYQYFFARGSASKISQAKDQIFSAFLGLIILLSSWFLLNFINPSFTKLSLSLNEIEKPKEYVPKEKPNESSYLVMPLGQYIENNFYSRSALEKIGKQTNDLNLVSQDFNNLKTLINGLASATKACKCGDCQCPGSCPCNSSCPNAVCDKDKISEISNKIIQEIQILSEESSKLQGDQNIFQTVKKMGTLMSLAENKNVDSYYTFLGGKNLLADSKTKLIEDCDPFSEWDSYWQKNKADPLTFYLNKSANKRLINDVLNKNINLDEIDILQKPSVEIKRIATDSKDKDFEIHGWMPIGEMANEIAVATKQTNDAIFAIINSVDSLIKVASSSIETANNCQSIDACQSDCKEVYNEGGCSCSGSKCNPEYLCDIAKIDSLINESNNISASFDNGKTNFIEIISANRLPPDYLKDLYGTSFTKLDKGHIYTDYNEFYKNFNELISPILAQMGQNVTLPVPNGQAIPFMEFIKRQSDYTRIGLLNCQTDVGEEQDMQDIADGNTIYKYPYRVDFILANRMGIPVDPNESNLNYYCASTKGVYTP
jgi:hypothetical protein